MPLEACYTQDTAAGDFTRLLPDHCSGQMPSVQTFHPGVHQLDYF